MNSRIVFSSGSSKDVTTLVYTERDEKRLEMYAAAEDKQINDKLYESESESGDDTFRGTLTIEQVRERLTEHNPQLLSTPTRSPVSQESVKAKRQTTNRVHNVTRGKKTIPM